jgi:hypothetical protein
MGIMSFLLAGFAATLGTMDNMTLIGAPVAVFVCVFASLCDRSLLPVLGVVRACAETAFILKGGLISPAIATIIYSYQ